MREIKVSVIVPVYNAQNYLRKCLDSICSQTLWEIEIICVDDGSNDDSMQILDTFLAREPRMQVLRQKRQFAGMARNRGMEAARGKYLVFWDADDWFHKDALRLMYEQCERDQAQICVCGADKYDAKTGVQYPSGEYLITKRVPEKVPFNKNDIGKYLFNFASNVPWNKMFLTSFIRKRGLRFQPLQQANDVSFVMLSLYFADTITIVDRSLVVYRSFNADSISGKASESRYCTAQAFSAVYSVLSAQAGFNDDLRCSFANKAIGPLLNAVRMQSQFTHAQELYDYYKNDLFLRFGMLGQAPSFYHNPVDYEKMQMVSAHSCQDYLLYDERRVFNDWSVANGRYRNKVRSLEKTRETLDKWPLYRLRKKTRPLMGKSGLKKLWKRTHFIRPLYWKIYRSTPVAAVRKYFKERERDRYLGTVLPELYAQACRNPVDPYKILLIVTRSQTEELPESFRVLYRRLLQTNRFEIHIHYMKRTFSGKAEYLQRAENMLRDLATARYAFIDEANEITSCIAKRKETCLVQLWHACGAFKKFGMSTAEKIFGDDRKQMIRHPNYANLDLVTVSSEEVRWVYIEAMALEKTPEVVQAMGISRTDIFYDPEFLAGARERVYELAPAARGKKIILYAPTFRGRVRTAQAPDRLDIEAFYRAFGDEYVLIIKHHPFVTQLPPIPKELDGSFAFDVTGKASISDLLSVSDICISDYSSIVFEYSLFERPMLFFAYDLEDYNDWRGFYYPYEEMTPGPVCQTNEAMIDYIQHLEERFDKNEVKQFREKFMSACDGHATERILDYVLTEQLPEDTY